MTAAPLIRAVRRRTSNRWTPTRCAELLTTRRQVAGNCKSALVMRPDPCYVSSDLLPPGARNGANNRAKAHHLPRYDRISSRPGSSRPRGNHHRSPHVAAPAELDPDGRLRPIHRGQPHPGGPGLARLVHHPGRPRGAARPGPPDHPGTGQAPAGRSPAGRRFRAAHQQRRPARRAGRRCAAARGRRCAGRRGYRLDSSGPIRVETASTHGLHSTVEAAIKLPCARSAPKRPP